MAKRRDGFDTVCKACRKEIQATESYKKKKKKSYNAWIRRERLLQFKESHTLEEIKKLYILHVLKKHEGNTTKAAQELQVSIRTIRNAIHKIPTAWNLVENLREDRSNRLMESNGMKEVVETEQERIARECRLEAKKEIWRKDAAEWKARNKIVDVKPKAEEPKPYAAPVKKEKPKHGREPLTTWERAAKDFKGEWE